MIDIHYFISDTQYEVVKMELYRELLLTILKQEKVEVVFSNLRLNPTELTELTCYKALQKIKAIIEDDSLEDNECFLKIEEIICVFENLGSNCGGRHDF